MCTKRSAESTGGLHRSLSKQRSNITRRSATQRTSPRLSSLRGATQPLQRTSPRGVTRRSFKKKQRGLTFSITWAAEQSSVDGRSISTVLNYKGTLVAWTIGKSLEIEKVLECGKIQCTKILAAEMEDRGMNLSHECDEISCELERVAHLVTNMRTGENLEDEDDVVDLDTKIVLKMDDNFVNDVGSMSKITKGDILYVNKIEIDKAYRGMGLGLYLLDAAERQINSPLSLTLLIPFPLMYTGAGSEPNVDSSKLQAEKRRLAKYYALLGFKELGWVGTNSWFMGKWNGFYQPERTRIENVCPGLFMNNC